ncbi:putative flavoprotein CzcO associated with the cation diffusion facilitator CzcD [Geosmithia morbida]|uniref:Flavoprotein CzcO associated with the cation diffusion facilitator CzcD n=1 Tax=Geosmithia morbida TaxID=1094350 RepID=A0A9P5D750_9HYPO|nr:putative flavoprotein CzcO associated with the cation diffusion facilitator CzcD [Geosmithia morbida]KAF4126256.1 putative flavoprotein CzcO associated with the cation diffusion facilitator CzcD [Geosmithia morbida]
MSPIALDQSDPASPKRFDHVINLPQTVPVVPPPNAWRVATEWLKDLESVFSSKDLSSLDELFHEDSWWRDILALQWDFRTIHGRDAIRKFLEGNQGSSSLTAFKIHESGKFQPRFEVVDKDTGFSWVSSMFHFETAIGRGSGVLRLTQEQPGIWKGFSVYTTLQELKEYTEPLNEKRWYGTIDSMPGGLAKGTWVERRRRQKEFIDEDPQVLVIGAGRKIPKAEAPNVPKHVFLIVYCLGQAGLNVGARLQSLGMTALIIDKNDRVGDNWRNRYRTLVTHDPAEFTHMAYLPFPKNWPQFTPKDKLGDWFEAYASIMELNVWTKTTLLNAVFHEAKSEWSVDLVRDGEKRTFNPKHIVFCTGHAGEPLVPSFPGQEDFQGEVYHGSKHQDASQSDVKGKKVIVVGTGNSGHDIAENFYENGADVTMLQRSGTYVLSLDRGVFMLHEGVHEDNGPPTEEGDIVCESLPYPVQFALCRGGTKRIYEADKETIQGLERAGFKMDYSIDGAGIARLYYTRGGGYYVDVGCSKLIIEKKIKIHQSPGGISGFTRDALILKDGTRLEADVVVLATGYDNMKTTARKVMGDKVASRLKDVWDLDEEGELNAMWRPSGHPNFWYMGGNLAICRIYSKYVALQIKAQEAGLN